MNEFNVIIFDYNRGIFKPYNIIPYLLEQYNEAEIKPSTFEEFKNFIFAKSAYQWWARCEYEIILSDFPNQKKFEKWDIHRQVKMNIDVITELLINICNCQETVSSL